MLSRREVLVAPVAAALTAGPAAAAGKMTLALHQNTSAGSGYRECLEGWARAGITQVELTNALIDGFLKNDSVPAARRVLTDLGLTPVCGACGVTGLWEPNPKRAAQLDEFKRRCEMYKTLGMTRIYSPTATSAAFKADDYKAGADNMREVAEIGKQFGMLVMAEALRNSTFISTLPTLLRLIRDAGHPNMAALFDFYHFYSGLSKLEDLEMIRPGEIGHVHFQDVPDMPRELLDSSTRFIPGDGIAPIGRILRALADKRYAGPLSVELFLPRFQQGDPFEVAREIRQKCERVMKQARVL